MLKLTIETAEQIKGRRVLDLWVSHIGTDKKRFAQLMTLVFCGQSPANDKASWVLMHIIEKSPSMFTPYKEQILTLLDEPSTKIMLKRHVIKAFMFTELPKDNLGLLVDRCFYYTRQPDEGKALRIYSMNVIERVLPMFPELEDEYALILHDILRENQTWLTIKAKRFLATRN